MRVEAREPNLDRMPLAYNLAWRATSARPPSARRSAHVSERFAGRAIPVLSNASPTPRLPAVPSRESPSSRVPSALPSSACRFGWRHPLVEGSPADGSLSRAGDECGAYLCLRSDDGTTTALHHRPGKEGPSRVPRGTGGLPPLPRPEQLRVEGSPLSRGRRDHCRSPMTRGPVTADGLAAPLRAARRRAAPPPDDY